jgi:hypothetical protein
MVNDLWHPLQFHDCEGQGLWLDDMRDFESFAQKQQERTLVVRSARWSLIRTLEFTVLVLLSFLLLAWLALSSARTIGTPFIPSLTLSLNTERLWAQYSPYYPVDEYLLLPRGCKVAQVGNLAKDFYLI